MGYLYQIVSECSMTIVSILFLQNQSLTMIKSVLR